MNVLVLAPHPDDEAIGCGGTLCHHADHGDSITAVFLTSGEVGLQHFPREEAWRIREAEARRASRILGIGELMFLRCSDWTLVQDIQKAADLLAPILFQKRPGLIYLPHPQDGHPDHRATDPIFRAALKSSQVQKPALRFFEVWTPLSSFSDVQDITPFMPRKLRALRAHKSQLNDFNYVRAVSGLNQYRGALAGKTKFAEVFLTEPS
jgi:N-acetylglucosamine malate deacetylase 1